jgi:hypothetical protein
MYECPMAHSCDPTVPTLFHWHRDRNVDKLPSNFGRCLETVVLSALHPDLYADLQEVTVGI